MLDLTFAGDLKGYVDETLAGLGVGRTIVASLPQFATLPDLIEGSPLIATVPDYVAGVLARDRRLKAEPTPFPSPDFAISMAWRAEVDTDPAEAWFRRLVLGRLSSGMAEAEGQGEPVARHALSQGA